MWRKYESVLKVEKGGLNVKKVYKSGLKEVCCKQRKFAKYLKIMLKVEWKYFNLCLTQEKCPYDQKY